MIAKWPSQVRRVSAYHRQQLKFNPRHTQKLTAETFGLSEKEVYIALLIVQQLKDPEIASASSADKAYKILLKRKKEKQSQILARLMA